MDVARHPESFILTSRAISAIDSHTPNYASFIRTASTCPGVLFRYPNGGLQINGDDETLDFLMNVLGDARIAGQLIDVNCRYRCLAPFGRHDYRLVYTGVSGEEVGEVTFGVVPLLAMPEHSSESRLDNLSIAVGFRRRLTKKHGDEFIRRLNGWKDTIAGGAIPDEGPASFASPQVEFQGPVARFRVDARRIGQLSMNWLVLSILDFSDDVRPVDTLVFGREDELDTYLGPPKGKSFVLPIGDSAMPAGAMEEHEGNESPESRVPADARPDPTLRSERFPVLVRSPDSWDAFRLAVYFTLYPEEEQRDRFRQLVESWLTIGEYGGLGKPGGRARVEFRFDEEAESAELRTDMTNTDPEIALPLLIRILEGFDSFGPTTIEAVVFGGQ